MNRTIISIIILLLIPVMISAKPGNDTLFEKNLFVKGTDTLPYRLLQPLRIIEGEKYPLVVFLHGSGERGTDNEKPLVHGTSLFADSIGKYPCFTVVPQCPEGKRWVDMDWSAAAPVQPEKISGPLWLTNELTDSLVQHLPVDSKRTYITGLSMGGQGVWDFLYRYPEKFAAAVPVCGNADSRIAAVIRDIPIWCFHGEKDDVVPVKAMENLVNAILSGGGNPVFTKYAEVGHNAWDYAYKEPSLLQWLFSHKTK